MERRAGVSEPPVRVSSSSSPDREHCIQGQGATVLGLWDLPVTSRLWSLVDANEPGLAARPRPPCPFTCVSDSSQGYWEGRNAKRANGFPSFVWHVCFSHLTR